jgi:hypothetical protein
MFANWNASKQNDPYKLILYIAHLRRQRHNSNFLNFQEKFLKKLTRDTHLMQQFIYHHK